MGRPWVIPGINSWVCGLIWWHLGSSLLPPKRILCEFPPMSMRRGFLLGGGSGERQRAVVAGGGRETTAERSKVKTVVVLQIVENRGVMSNGSFLQLFAASRQVWQSTKKQEAKRFEQFELTIGTERTNEMWAYAFDEPDSGDDEESLAPSVSIGKAITADRVRRCFWSMFWKHAQRRRNAARQSEYDGRELGEGVSVCKQLRQLSS